LDTRVTVQMGAKKGKIVVEFGDSDDFERITDLLKLPRD
ncbi:MAG: cell division protein, partial [Corynebacterium variabile]